jgi:hypothetical protein
MQARTVAREDGWESSLSEPFASGSGAGTGTVLGGINV